MKLEKLIVEFFNNPLVYRLHSSQVDREKIAAIKKIQGDFTGLRILDVGCGPGNNAMLFAGADYTGIDINERYIDLVKKRYPRLNFVAGDAEEVNWPSKFDVVLLNSFLHHLDDRQVREVLKKTVVSLRNDGIVIMQEPLIPRKKEWYHRLLMTLDRGDYFRSRKRWEELVAESWLIGEVKELYELRVLGIKGYHMVSMLLRKPS